jgi:hypothetical protein
MRGGGPRPSAVGPAGWCGRAHRSGTGCGWSGGAGGKGGVCFCVGGCRAPGTDGPRRTPCERLALGASGPPYQVARGSVLDPARGFAHSLPAPNEDSARLA